VSICIYGINAVDEAIRQRRPLRGVLLLNGERNARLRAIAAAAAGAGVAVRLVERTELDELSGGARHQGVAALLSAPARTLALDELLAECADRQRFFLVADGVTDPHNFGALIRSAAAAGCQAVIVARDRSCPVTAVVEKAAAGAVAHIALCRVTNLVRSLETLRNSGVWVYGLAGEGSTSLYGVDLQGDVALVVGSEGRGLRPLVRKHCDALLHIPMPGAVQSLNVSVAAAVAMFEVVRQRRNAAG